MLLREDKDMLLNTLLSRIKNVRSSKKQKSAQNEHLRISEYIDSGSSSDMKNVLTPMMKNSTMTMPDSCKNNRKLFGSPLNSDAVNENEDRQRFFRKSEDIQ